MDFLSFRFELPRLAPSEMSEFYLLQAIMTGTVAPVVQEGGTQMICLGTSIAVVSSWHRNKSILWAILHGVLSWFYVIYFALTREKY